MVNPIFIRTWLTEKIKHDPKAAQYIQMIGFAAFGVMFGLGWCIGWVCGHLGIPY